MLSARRQQDGCGATKRLAVRVMFWEVLDDFGCQSGLATEPDYWGGGVHLMSYLLPETGRVQLEIGNGCPQSSH
jgi:hypothetical protein